MCYVSWGYFWCLLCIRIVIMIIIIIIQSIIMISWQMFLFLAMGIWGFLLQYNCRHFAKKFLQRALS